jgi:hypothetical protein
MRKPTKSSTSLSSSVHENTHFSFVSNAKKVDKIDGADADKTRMINFELFMNLYITF